MEVRRGILNEESIQASRKQTGMKVSSKEEEDGSRKQALMGGVAQLSRIIKFDSVLQTENQAGGHVMNG